MHFSLNEVKGTCRECKMCAELKPQFCKQAGETLVKATRPWERIVVDFKGPVKGKMSYVLVIDEISRFHLRFPWRDVSSKTIIQSLTQLFCPFGMPGYVNSDRGSAFMASELRGFLRSCNVATSRTPPYHPEGNSQCERLNSTLWKTVKLMLHTRNLQEEQWDQILPDPLHAIRSLLCTATNQTPHERFLCYERRSMHGRSLPGWFLTPGPVFMKRFVRYKSDPLVDRVEWLSSNPHFAFICCVDGRGMSASTWDSGSCHSFAEEGKSCETVHPQDACIERSSGSSHATVDRCEKFADTSLNRTETVAVRGSSDEPDNQPSGPDEHAFRPSPEVSSFGRSSRVPKPI